MEDSKSTIDRALAFFGLKKIKQNPFISSDTDSKLEKGSEGDPLTASPLGKGKEGVKDLFEKAQKIINIFDGLEKIRSTSEDRFDKLEKGLNEFSNSFEKAVSEAVERRVSTALEEIEKRIKGIESIPQPRKSFTSIQEVERFEKGQEGKTALSLSRDTKKISDFLFANLEKIGDSGRRDLFEKAIIQVEGSKTMPVEMIKLLQEENIQIIQ